MGKSATRQGGARDPEAAGHVCPWWLGPVLASPLRRLIDNPDAMLAQVIEPDMIVLDFGCAMGFHSLPAARLVGGRGRVISVDIQPRMLEGLRRRAARAGLLERIETRQSGADNQYLADLEGTVDVALAIHVIHETPDPARVLAQLHAVLRPGGQLLLAEPVGHVSQARYAATIELARAAGFRVSASAKARRSRADVLER